MLSKIIPVACFVVAAFYTGVWYGTNELRQEQLEADFKLLKAVAKRNLELDKELALAKENREVITKEIIKEVPKYVPIVQKADSICNISLGTKQLLDHAAKGLPFTAGQLITADTGLTSVTEEDLILYAISTIDSYNKVKEQCNLLIEWHK